MPGRNYNNNHLALENEVVTIYALLTIGASGAVTLTRGKGITSAAKTNTGRYTLTLQDKHKRLLYGNAQLLRASGTADIKLKLNAETVDSTKTVEIGVTKSSDGTVLEPTSGDLIYVKLELGTTAL